MKPIKRAGDCWEYILNHAEADLLRDLLTRFPQADDFPAQISRTDKDPKAAGRERLLNESLAEHRRELQRQAMKLLADDRLRRRDKSHLLKLSGEDREILLQILNDIRVGCWRALGQPETLDFQPSGLSARELAQHSLMNLAGYFEHHLIGED